ncbi:MAG: hypothetical protein WCZ01_02415 [Candidatus Neomarinimicrobiota bacterium]|nr:hypothetical protein [Anaerolineaceae bacterium]
MLPVIRIGDSVNRSLEKYAVGSDALSNVSERLIERYESHQNNSNRSNSELNTTNQALRNSSTLLKKCRNPENEKLKDSVGKNLNWGTFQIISKTVLEFHDSSKKVWSKYSSYSSDLEIWFWVVSLKYYSIWDDNWYLALLIHLKMRYISWIQELSPTIST